MEICIYDHNAIYDLGNTLKKEISNSHIGFEGFTYFEPGDIVIYDSIFKGEQLPPIFFVTKYNNKVVGIIKLGHYVRKNPDYKFWAINYIDVHRNFRKQGIAKYLYCALNDWGKDKKIVIVGSMLSKDGKEAKLYDLRKRLLTDVVTYDTEDSYYKDIYQKKPITL